MKQTARKVSMFGRITFGILLATCSLLPRSVEAQGYPPYGAAPASYSTPGQLGPQQNAYGVQSPQMGVQPASFSFAQVPYGNPIVGAGEHLSAAMEPAALHLGHTGNSRTRNPNVSPWESTYDSAVHSQFGQLVRTALNESWVQLEYLHWSIGNPGEDLLGSQSADGSDPRDTFTITSPIVGTAQVLDTERIGLRDNNGIRGTLGIPLTMGTFEVRGFLLEQATDRFDALEIPNNNSHVIATSTTFNGIDTGNLRAYDASFSSTYSSEIWGVDATVVFDTALPGEGFKFRPLAGFRFLGVRENLSQLGVSSSLPDFVTLIESDSSNYIYGVNAGFETTLEHRWFTLGIRPQLMVGANTYRNSVSTEGWISPSDPVYVDEHVDTQFAVVGELGAFARIPLRENINFHIGLTGMWFLNVERPGEAIVYDTNAVNGIPVSSNFQARKTREQLKVYGLSVGAEIIWK